jgi:hypothetical protein
MIYPLIQGRINVPRGQWHIISAGSLAPPAPTLQPPNTILDTEFSTGLMKKYPIVFHALKSFLCIYKIKELYINNLIEPKFNAVHTINIIIIYKGK